MKNVRNIVSVLILSLILPWQTVPIAAEIYKSDEYQIEVTLVPEKPVLMLGEPAYFLLVVFQK